MYREQILEHYKHPHNRGKMEKPDAYFEDSNPLCGDEIQVYFRIQNGVVADVKFQGQGCAISTASASLLTDYVKGKKVADLKDLSKKNVFDFLGVPLSPARVKCALLSLKAVKSAAYAYLGEMVETEKEG
jgi:nitrogen fixation protein NifU and related proteins